MNFNSFCYAVAPLLCMRHLPHLLLLVVYYRIPRIQGPAKQSVVLIKKSGSNRTFPIILWFYAAQGLSVPTAGPGKELVSLVCSSSSNSSPLLPAIFHSNAFWRSKNNIKKEIKKLMQHFLFKEWCHQVQNYCDTLISGHSADWMGSFGRPPVDKHCTMGTRSNKA